MNILSQDKSSVSWAIPQNTETLAELANVLWDTESYPRKINTWNPLWEADKIKNHQAKEQFQKLFMDTFDGTILYGINESPLYLVWIKFNTNYNNYSIQFSTQNPDEEQIGRPWFVMLHSDNGRIYVDSIESKNKFTLSDEDKNILSSMFSFHSTIQHHKRPIQFSTN
jgi:hypothetical protein